MSRLEKHCQLSSCEYWTVSQAAANLMNQACTISARHIKNSTLRIQFNREVSYYARAIVNDVAEGRKSPEQALKDIKSEQNSLLSQSMEVAQKGIGAVVGALQFAAGVGICYGSVGTLCLLAGAPMIAHGANNVYENGRNILENRSDTQGPVRQGYQSISKWLGGEEAEGNIAYGVMDLGLSAYGVGRLMLKPDAWRLFRYIRTDYVRAYEDSTKLTLSFGAASDMATLNSIHQEAKKP
ncbi:DUF4225 domain-containing protein [Pseudomonas sp. Pseusp122]|uniref:DUF4225 domain-containing protein n=1 Tax=unclassified Pseudomonas TaxID=196821 RepID=UPI0039A5ABFE